MDKEVERICNEVKEKTGSDKVMLSFSGGKDAWATWCAIKDILDVYPFFYYSPIDELEYFKPYLAYCEKKMGRHIARFPAPSVLNCLSKDGLVFQPPYRCIMLERLDIQPYTFEELQYEAASYWGLPQNTYTALGVRAADSVRRALHFKQHGAITDNRHKFYPVWHWKKEDLIECFKKHDIKLSIDYKLFGRTGEYTSYTYIKKLKDNFPVDYQRIKEFFPLVVLEDYRYEKVKETRNI